MTRCCDTDWVRLDVVGKLVSWEVATRRLARLASYWPCLSMQPIAHDGNYFTSASASTLTGKATR